ncbi:Qat anti-phage system QueC-like protein QatC [Devosia sp.]|uniref:Qat anti-phage system QueC-like protein QatC n=1 Tax=Devosia sp. TaxID=1871048 RepID=UPI0029314594|nr:Qat anti-phage system QueC-like protein QatC [Devosia sp.]
MTRYVISGRAGTSDTFEPKLADHEVLANVDLRVRNEKQRQDLPEALGFGIGDALLQACRQGLTPTDIGVDVLVLAALVYAADTRVNRSQASQDQWTRELRVVVPVSDPALWDKSSELLAVTLGFLTGDLWCFEFRALPSPHLIPSAGALGGPAPFDCISLFSGGLDSLIGAIDLLEKGEQRPLFVSHKGSSAVSKRQEDLFNALGERYKVEKRRPSGIRLGLFPPSELFEDIEAEPSTRGRSFLFFALAAMAGSGLGRSFDLWVPENGLISLNVPLDITRLGSNSTRTTHPFYMHRWNELLGALGIPGKLTNPYWDKTKGDMVMGCRNADVLEALHADSVSCGHPDTARWGKHEHPHCGTCLPCIIRRAALRNTPWAGGDGTGYQLPDLAAQPLRAGMASEGLQVRGFQMALHRLAMRPSLARSLVYKPGPLREDVAIVPDLVDVYARGMAEVGAVLQNVVTVS